MQDLKRSIDGRYPECTRGSLQQQSGSKICTEESAPVVEGVEEVEGLVGWVPLGLTDDAIY
eukprot:scaffold871_cov130-Cylindrotheca_fusiformis.AAC.38